MSLIKLALISFILTTSGSNCQSTDKPPDVQTYRAVGELVALNDPNTNNHTNLQILFEENFDSVAQRCSLTVTILDQEITIVEYIALKQMFVYMKGLKACQPFSPSDFEASNLAPIHLKSLIIKNGSAIFPVRQLLSLSKEGGPIAVGKTVYRDIPAQAWNFKIHDGPDNAIEISAYWSSDNFTSPSKTKQVPLGYQIRKMLLSEQSAIYSVNFYLFTHDEFDVKAFEPPRGIYCDGRKDPSPEFPDVSKMETLAYKSEYVWEDYKTFSAVDSWIDPLTQIYRVDLIPSSAFNLNPKDISRIVSKPQGVYYDITKGSNEGCLVLPISEGQFDPQTILDFRQDNLNISSFFGINSAKYYPIGKTSDRGIPCVLYHGIRSDWPTQKTNIKTLWEWCISNDKNVQLDFPKDRYPIVSLNIYVKESPYTESTGVFYQGLQFTHHFHNAKSLSSKYMDAAFFDIRDCFEVTNIKELSFVVDVPGDSLESLSNQDRDPEFVGGLKYAVISAANLTISSMRVSGLRVTVQNSALRVNFALLGRHPKLPESSLENTLDESFNALKSIIDSGNLKLNFTLDVAGKKMALTLSARPGSLTSRIRIDDYDAPLTYSAGVMAAVAFIMLLLGLAVGAGGVFTRYTYFKTTQQRLD